MNYNTTNWNPAMDKEGSKEPGHPDEKAVDDQWKLPSGKRRA